MKMKAREFAVHYHTYETLSGVPDLYDGLPYVDAHVDAVVRALFEHRDIIVEMVGEDVFTNLVIAAYLHDAVEDTKATIRMIARRFGLPVARLVWAVTGVGATRVIRNADMERKILLHLLAAILKLADRIANVRASEFGSKHRKMYWKELPHFETYIRPYVPAAMWETLLRAFD
jgi:(p)ppGpp synthase/HD superfamily hydrolase